MNDERDILSRLDPRFNSKQIKRLTAIELQRRGARVVFELTRQHTHADEIAAMDALEALSDDDLHSKQQRAFCGPVAG